MTFSAPHGLWALTALPLLLLLEWLAVRRADRALVALAGTRPGTVLLAQRRPGQRRFSLALRLGALALLVVGAAGPEWGRELTRRPATGSDLLFVIDVSASMDVRDVTPSRLDEARREALAVLDRAGGGRVGIVAFAGDAVGLCPLTQDLAAARLSLESLSSTSVSEPGTDLGRALKMAAKLMPPGRREEKVILLWTDGEDLERGAQPVIQDLANSGMRVFAIGVGTPSGDVVPVLDADGHTVDVKRDENGTAVKSRLDEDLLRSIARRTRGAYFTASRPGGDLARLIGALGGVARATHGDRLVERPVARFPLFGGGALLLLTLLGLRARRRVNGRSEAPIDLPPPTGPEPRPAALPAPERPRKRPRPAVAARTAGLLLGALLLSGVAGPARGQSAWARGDRAFRDGRYADAESLYALRMGKNGPGEVAVNRATAQALGGKRDRAIDDLTRHAGDPGEVGRTARYNLGTVQGEMGQLDEALRSLREALERNPADEDARWNYEILLRRKQHPNPQPNSPQPRPPQPQPPQPQPSQQSRGNPPPQPPQNSGTPEQPQNGGNPGSMSRAQAEQLLNALQEMARADRQRQQKVRVLRERRGKDW